MGRRILRRHIWGYSVCLCPIKGTPGFNELKSGPLHQAGKKVSKKTPHKCYDMHEERLLALSQQGGHPASINEYESNEYNRQVDRKQKTWRYFTTAESPWNERPLKKALEGSIISFRGNNPHS